MLFSVVPATLLLLLSHAVSAAPLTTELAKRRTVILAAGSSYTQGVISSNLRWQSSGQLTSGGCPSSVKIGTCWSMHLASRGMLARRSDSVEEDASSSDDVEDEEESVNDESTELAISSTHTLTKRMSKQRIEIFSWPPAASGASYRYTWKSYLPKGTSTTNNYQTLWQLLRRDGPGGAVIRLDARSNKIYISDTVRKCGTSCVVTPLSAWVGQVVTNTITMKYGKKGSFSYTAVAGGKTLTRYSASGDMGTDGSVKVGLYRKVVSGMKDIDGYVGDWSAKKM